MSFRHNKKAAPFGVGVIIIIVLDICSMVSPAFGEPGWSDVEALFATRCTMCHSGEHAARGLRLDSREGVLAGGERGRVLVPGDPSASEVVRRVRGESTPRMPFLSRPLAAEEIALIERWIGAGAPP